MTYFPAIPSLIPDDDSFFFDSILFHYFVFTTYMHMLFWLVISILRVLHCSRLITVNSFNFSIKLKYHLTVYMCILKKIWNVNFISTFHFLHNGNAPLNFKKICLAHFTVPIHLWILYVLIFEIVDSFWVVEI